VPSLARPHVLVLTIYCAATALLLLVAGSVLALAEGRQRLRLVAELNSWFPGSLTVVGLLWLLSAVLAIILAYQTRARILALAIAGSYAVTSALIYAWASTIAFSGAGAWDVLGHVTAGGAYPLAAVFLIVSGGALLTLIRGAGAERMTGGYRDLDRESLSGPADSPNRPG
jgi:uncharacterized membrane protein